MREERVSGAADPVTPVYDWQGGRLPVVTATYIGPHRLARPEGEDAFVPYGHGLALPAKPIDIEIDDLGVVIVFGVVDGKPGVTQIRAQEGRLLTVTLLKRLPSLRKLTAMCVSRVAVRVMQSADGALVAEKYLVAPGQAGEERRQLEADLAGAGKKAKRTRRTIDDDFLEQVATVYREAVALGLPTQQTLQEKFGPTSGTTANRWIVTARQQGFLGPARADGKAGEATRG